LLLLLALLLPLRGVAGVPLLCEQQPASHAAVALAQHGHGHETAGDMGQHHSQADNDHGGVEKGRHCLSSSSAPTLVGQVPTLAAPVANGFIVFPHFAAPAPTFLSDGQERPPRSI
jgi:hypothetical protein